ncbi:hypothetical protein LPJ64_005029 [Coemansia asiatica]|uniref:Eukaryotic translation initiation factor 2A n=1 Tax=Coemansia asiatica TaxID=1052880 RepID=A0A9W7XHT6_9FUNG|nr:hypothetical protein LPJ64_005029 [Coemansia asiatica]
MSTKEETQFAFRAAKEMGVWTAPPKAASTEVPEKPTEEVRALKYSPNGQYLAWTTVSETRVVDAQTLATVAIIARKSIVDVRFSPKGTYLITWERFSQNAAEGDDNSNLRVWETATGQALGGFKQNNFSASALQWTDDERFCAKLFSGEVRFYTPTALGRAALKLALDGITEFSVSPGLSPSVAVFVPERGSKPGMVRMYNVGSFAQPTASKTFFKADKVEFHWHRLGTNLLVLTQTDVDKTGRSYYGESALYFMAAAGNFDCRVPLDREGPIHDVVWNPEAKEFAVSYGFMPAKTALFNHRAEMVHDFGTAHRNFIRFNPHGRVLAIAGFGNLSGQVDLWDRRSLKKVATIDAQNASFCKWCPDGRYLLAATLSPRLRVDNGIRIWHYSGSLVYFKEISELYQVDWRPAPATRFPQRPALSPAPAGIVVSPRPGSSSSSGPGSGSPAPAAKPATAYRPPHARSRDAGSQSAAPRSLADIAEQRIFGAAAPSATRTVPGAPPKKATAAAAAAAADGKRRNRNKAKKTAEASPAPSAPSPAPSPADQPPAAAPTTEVEILKRVRALKKKVGQIDSLIKRRDAGEALELNQLSKIESRSEIESEIDELNQQLSQLTASTSA